MATASAAAVAVSASATPGATALKLPEPLVAMPMKASITPSTVPKRPMSGLTEPIVASHGMKCESRSRSSDVSESSTSRSASTCDALNGEVPTASRSAPGFISAKKLTAREKMRVNGLDGLRRTRPVAVSSAGVRANSRVNARPTRPVFRNSHHFASMIAQLTSDKITSTPNTICVTSDACVIMSMGAVGMAPPIWAATGTGTVTSVPPSVVA